MSAGTVLHHRLSMCTKGFPFVQEFAFLTWNLCISYKDTLYELDKCFLQVLVIPECALLELQHCRPSNWPGFAPKQRPLPLPLVPASSQLFFLVGCVDLHYKAVLVVLLVCLIVTGTEHCLYLPFSADHFSKCSVAGISWTLVVAEWLQKRTDLVEILMFIEYKNVWWI